MYEYLAAKYGFALPSLAASSASGATSSSEKVSAQNVPAAALSSAPPLAEQILVPTLLRKQLSKEDYQEHVTFDVAFSGSGLDKPTRAVKGVMRYMDLFGEQKFALNWTIDKPLSPGETFVEKGYGFKYNQFIDSHQWVQSTTKENMKIAFQVKSILYADGTSKDID